MKAEDYLNPEWDTDFQNEKISSNLSMIKFITLIQSKNRQEIYKLATLLLQKKTWLLELPF